MHGRPDLRNNLMSKDIVSGLERRGDLGGPFSGLVDQDLRGPRLGAVVNPGCVNLDPAEAGLVCFAAVAIACGDIRQDRAVWVRPRRGPLEGDAASCADRRGKSSGSRVLVAVDIRSSVCVGCHEATV